MSLSNNEFNREIIEGRVVSCVYLVCPIYDHLLTVLISLG